MQQNGPGYGYGFGQQAGAQGAGQHPGGQYGVRPMPQPGMHQPPMGGPQPITDATYDYSSDGTRQTTGLVYMAKEEILQFNHKLFSGHELLPSMPNTYAVVECQLDPTRDVGMVANALITGAMPLVEGTNLIRFYQFPGCQGGAAYGLSHQGIYGNGWALRGALINASGNLSSNSLLKSQYCPGYSPNSIVDMICEVFEGIVSVYFYVGEQCYGHAYALDFRHNPSMIGQLKPVVQFGDNSCGSRVMIAMHPPAPIGAGSCPWRLVESTPVQGNPCL